MEMLNSMNMLLSFNLWKTLIDAFSGWIVNYGWTIIVFTILLKLVLSPIDVMQRIASQKQSRAMAIMQPELDAIKQKYPDDPQRQNEETNKVYKKHNVNLGGMCFTMLISMVITMVVFFTLYSSIRSYGNEKLYTTYAELDTAYVEAVAEYNNLSSSGETTLTQDEYLTVVIQNKYDELSKQNGWFWVKNVWKTDTNTSQFVDFDDYAEYMGFSDSSEGNYLSEASARYDFITGVIVADSTDVNGYYILIVLAGVVSFLTQFLSAKILAPKGQKLNTMNKVMMVMMPVFMIVFASTSNVVFTLYQITNSLMTAILSTIMSLIFRKKRKNGEDILVKKKNVEVVEYSRNYKK